MFYIFIVWLQICITVPANIWTRIASYYLYHLYLIFKQLARVRCFIIYYWKRYPLYLLFVVFIFCASSSRPHTCWYLSLLHLWLLFIVLIISFLIALNFRLVQHFCIIFSRIFCDVFVQLNNSTHFVFIWFLLKKMGRIRLFHLLYLMKSRYVFKINLGCRPESDIANTAII